MEKIELVFLGTGGTVPTVSRNPSGIFLKYKDKNILVDCGEGIQRQMRIAKVNPCKLTDILITHWHGDHVLGLPGLFESLALNNYGKVLRIYGPPMTKKFIDKFFEIFVHTKKIEMDVREVTGKVFENKDFKISALRLKHGAYTNGYLFEEKNKLRIDKKKLGKVLGKLKVDKAELKKVSELNKGRDVVIGGKKLKHKDLTYGEIGRKIAFIFDTGDCSNIKKLAKDVDVAIIDATFSGNCESKACEYKHLTVGQATQVAKGSGVKKLFLTHISQRNEFKSKQLLKEAKKIFKNVEIAEDFIKVVI